MAVNDEKLKVQFEVDLEQLKRQLGQAGVAFEQAAAKTEKSTTKMATGIQNVEQKSGFLVAKLQSIGKAAAAAFAFDLTAKVFGFSGIMDAISKATDKAAETIRLAGQYILGLGEKADAADVKVKRLADRIAEIRGALKTTEDFVISPRRGEGFPVDIPKFEDQASNLRALELVEAAQRRIRDLSDEAARGLGAESYAAANSTIKELADEWARIDSDAIIEGVRADLAALSKEVADAPAKLKRATDEHNRWVKSLERGAALAARERAEQAFTRFATPFANVGVLAAQNAVARVGQRAFDMRSSELQAAERDNARLEQFARKAVALSKFVADAGVTVFNELEAVRQQREADLALSQKFVDDYAASLQKSRLEAELALDPFDQLGAAMNQIADTASQRRLSLYEAFVADGDEEKLRELLALVDAIEAKQQGFLKSSGTFSGQVANRMKQIEQSISDLGGQQVDIAFNSFRGFFRDILSGSATASEAFRSFAASVIGGIADMIAQWLALRAVGFLFGGGAGFPFAASTAAPTGAGVSAAPIYGAGSNAAGLGASRGAPVTINLVVQSLDPRTAADVVLGAMPQIQGALAAVISGGSDRRLIEQLRSVR